MQHYFIALNPPPATHILLYNRLVHIIHNSTQSVCINGMLSSKTVLLHGVPQGSVLGPQFFIIYTGPIAGIVKKHGLQVHLYADDIELYISF